jgi:hypothetical protein
MPLVLKMATLREMSWGVLQLAKKESVVTAMQRAFHTLLLRIVEKKVNIAPANKGTLFVQSVAKSGTV